MTDPKEPAVAEVVPETETDTQSDEVTQLQAELEKAQTEAANNYEQFLRTQAELANQRRRADKQIEDAHKYAAQKFVEALLPVVDSLEMGMQAQGDVEQIREGMALTLKQFESMMDKFHIEAVGNRAMYSIQNCIKLSPCSLIQTTTIIKCRWSCRRAIP